MLELTVLLYGRPERRANIEQPLFKKEDLKRVSSPEQLNDYLHVTTPVTWIVLAAVVLILASLFIWSSVTAVEKLRRGRGGGTRRCADASL